MRVTRDHEYDDKERARNVGIRLDYTSLFGDDVGLKTGVLLEVGFDTTQPSTACDISSWAFDRALGRIEIEDNRALKISCYHPGYTFVEKLHAVIRKFQRYRRGEGLPRNFLRHYYDLYQLLEHPQVKAFVGTPKYHEHKKVRFGSIDHDISKSEAFKLSAPDEFAEFEKQYKATAILYFKGQPALRTILDRLQANVANL